MIEFFLIILLFTGFQCNEHEKKLHKFLFDPNKPNAYNKLTLPSNVTKKPVTVSVEFSLIQLIAVDEKSQSIQTNMWIASIWKDYQLQWDPMQYDGISEIRLPSDKIWKPDLVLYNNANNKMETFYPVHVVVRHNSRVVWIPPVVMRSNCPMDVAWFPFDTQECQLKIGSWTYSANEIDLKLQCLDFSNGDKNETSAPCKQKEKINLKDYVVNSEFDIYDSYVKRNEVSYTCCPEYYVDLTITMKLRRKPLYYTFYFIVPCILISLLVLLVFIISPGSGEKITLGIMLLLAMTLFLLLVSEKLPRSSVSIPIISVYIFSIMVLCSLSIAFSVLVMNFYHEGNNAKPMPTWLRTLLNNWLATILLMQIKRKDNRNDEIESKGNIEGVIDQNSSASMGKQELAAVLTELKKLTKRIKNDEEDRETVYQWKFAAAVIDRLCLFIFTLVTFILTLIILISLSKH